MAKPTDIPTWDSNETDTTEPTTARKDDGWIVTASVPEKPPYQMMNWWQNNVYKWINWIKDKVSSNVTVVTTQAEFDVVFDGVTILQNRVIYLESTGSPYDLAVVVPFGGNLKIDSDPGVTINRRNVVARFESQGTIGTPIKNIHFTKNWFFDGVKATYTVSGNGGFADISYVEDSIFEPYINNCKCSGNGGGYFGAGNKNCVLSNMYRCDAANGGGVADVDYAKISNIFENFADATGGLGGGLYACTHCIITDVYDNIGNSDGGGLIYCNDSTILNVYGNSTNVNNGGGCYGCDDCTISNVYSNESAADGGGVYDCDNCTIDNVNNNTAPSASAQGGGLHSCNYCTITNVYENSVPTTTTGSLGGGLAYCDYCTISNVHSNISYFHGGGLANCNNCSITDVRNNDATTQLGGGAYSCTDCVFLGDWTGNTAGTYKFIGTAVSSISFAIEGGGTNSIVTTRGNFNWN